MAVATFTKSGTKAASPAKLDKAVFGVEVANHQLIKEAYLAHLANSRPNLAASKKRGEVRGGGRKPWRQKGTGRARAGSIRSPLWRGGGITFGPTGSENYSRRLSASSRRQALRQALSLAADAGKIIIIEDFQPSADKTKAAAALLSKMGAGKSVLLVLDDARHSARLAVRNIDGVSSTLAKDLNTLAAMNADTIILTKKALEAVQVRLGAGNG